MKKLLFVLLVASVLFCFLAVGASAVTTYDDFDVKGLQNIEYRADDVIVFDDGFSCPSVYVFKDTKSIGKGNYSSPDGLKNALDFTYINTKVAPKVYGFDDIDSIDIPQGVTSMGQYACNSLSTIRIISIPDTLVSFGGTCFQNATGLEYCIMEHGEKSTLTTLPGTMFSGSGLKAFSMPDSITTLDKGNEFGNCKSLTAVYLSKNLTTITIPSGKTVTFDYCDKLYLVNEPFVAKNESQVPAKPSIYYFPSNLTVFGTSEKGVFRGSKSINDVLVFGTGVTAITNRVCFQDCPANTVVFLGNMTDIVAYEQYYWGTKNFIFANSNDKSASDLNTLAVKSDRNVYFCYGEDFKHIKELTKTTEATCTEPSITADFCFCGKSVPGTETTVGNALGHSYTICQDIVYESYMTAGYKTCECDRCGDVKDDIKAPELFICFGYSIPEGNRDGIAVSYSVNYLAIEEYEVVTGNKLTYGVFAVAQEKLGEGDVFGENGAAPSKAIIAELSNSKVVSVALKIVGFTEKYYDTKLAMGVYVTETTDEGMSYAYLQAAAPNAGEKYSFISYNGVAGQPSTEEKTEE